FVKKDNNYLTADEIEKSAIFHQKVGILTDDVGDSISFSGSINESYQAWNSNVEEFKVFKSWEDVQCDYLKDDKEKFDKYWNGESDKLLIKSLPESVEQKLLEISKDEDINIIRNKLKNNEVIDELEVIDNEVKITKSEEKEIDPIPLFSYQAEAKKKWFESDKRMLFCMATATGKTRTAVSCLYDCMQQTKAHKFVIVATPESTLTMQWKSEVEKFDIKFDASIIVDSTNRKWKEKLSDEIIKMNLNLSDSCIVFTTHATASSSNFIYIIKKINKNKTAITFVGDEVHSLGSNERKKALLEIYDYRIGLSATPSRWFDDDGTKVLEDYFNNSIYEFGIDQALRTNNPLTCRSILAPYLYYPVLVYLTNDEEEKYADYDAKIKKMYALRNNEDFDESKFQMLCQRRADIIKTASNKVIELDNMLNRINKKDIKNAIIFTSSEMKNDIM
ncbi:MAG: DEAD/DEAH box helicase family protein, partial [Bacilli bacterium]